VREPAAGESVALGMLGPLDHRFDGRRRPRSPIPIPACVSLLCGALSGGAVPARWREKGAPSWSDHSNHATPAESLIHWLLAARSARTQLEGWTRAVFRAVSRGEPTIAPMLDADESSPPPLFSPSQPAVGALRSLLVDARLLDVAGTVRNLKLGPCGDGWAPPREGDAFRPGQTIEVTVDETIFHPATTASRWPSETERATSRACRDRGRLRSLRQRGDPGPADLPCSGRRRPAAHPAVRWASDVPVTLPGDVTCTGCTLQVIEYMSHHGRPCFYHHCAVIDSRRSRNADAHAHPTETTPPLPTATNTLWRRLPTTTPGDRAICAGDRRKWIRDDQ
jgi:hypothetical protein